MWCSPVWSIDLNAVGALRKLVVDQGPALFAGPAREAEANGLPLKVRDGIGVVQLRGPMMKNVSPAMEKMCGLQSTSSLTRAVNAAAQDAKVETILVAVDSPGGSVDGLDALGDAVNAAAKVKPVVAQVDGMAASAAYYAIAGATEIRAGRMDLTGSIGTRMVLWDQSERFNKAGIEVVAFDTGPLKSAGEDGLPITDEQRAFFQNLVDTYFADFKQQVMKGRGFTEQQMKAASTGGVWVTGDAIGMGLVDKQASFRETYAELIGDRQIRRARMTARSTTMRMQATAN